MTLIKRNPHLPELINQLFSSNIVPFENVFDEIVSVHFPEIKNSELWSATKHSYPKVNIRAYNDKVILQADIGGLSKEDINIEVKDDVLILSGNKKFASDVERSEDEDFVWLKREISTASFRRVFTIGENLDTDNIKAEFKNGLLTITIQKKVVENKEVTKKIEIV
jgi:HSP20 family protein